MSGPDGWRDENCPWTTWVYGLTYPGRGLFYVGVSVNPEQRFGNHWSADGCCSSHQVIRKWKRFGERFDTILFGEFPDRIDALRLERSLILNVPNLVNGSAGQGMLSRRRYPIGDDDDWLLMEAIERVGGIPGFEFKPQLTGIIEIDRSADFADARYDEWDCIDA